MPEENQEPRVIRIEDKIQWDFVEKLMCLIEMEQRGLAKSGRVKKVNLRVDSQQSAL